jgi:hypothetical protein
MLTPDRIDKNIDDLKSKLAVFTRLCSSLRNAKVRNESLISACQREVDLIRAAIRKCGEAA